jgi:hypothetical protein
LPIARPNSAWPATRKTAVSEGRTGEVQFRGTTADEMLADLGL